MLTVSQTEGQAFEMIHLNHKNLLVTVASALLALDSIVFSKFTTEYILCHTSLKNVSLNIASDL